MRVTIVFDLPDEVEDMTASGDTTSVDRVLSTVGAKVVEQLGRTSDCLCVALEHADVLRDNVGQIVGRVHVTRSLRSRSRQRFNRGRVRT